MVDESPMKDNGAGLVPADDGWFVVNVRDAAWRANPAFGTGCAFEAEPGRFPQLGIRLRVFHPGQPNCMYHKESGQEDFLVIQGECLLLIEGKERPLKAWDFVHCPSHTEHVFVAVGKGPCVMLMVGARSAEKSILYPLSDLARRHGAGVAKETPSPEEAYAPFPPWQFQRVKSHAGLPWE
jgi:uncharacterized cupin superfamily protein